jgi:UDP-glucose 4-epimerase
MPKVLVTGGAGFIGSNLAYALVARGDDVRVLDNFSTGRDENLAGLANKIDLRRGDLRDAETVAKAVQGVEVVFHQGALPSVPRSVDDPMTTDQVNVTGTLHVLEAARRAGVRRVVFAASSSAYGETAVLPKVETMLPDPLSPYAASKVAAEHYLRCYHACYGLETVALRYFNVFGPRQDPRSQYAAVIPNFVSAYLAARAPIVYGDGLQSRDFCFIDNAVEANLRAAVAEGAAGRVFNIACGVRTTLLDVLDRLAAIFGRRIEPRFEPARAGDIKHSLADIRSAREMLGYTAAVSFEDGLLRTVDWYRAR